MKKFYFLKIGFTILIMMYLIGMINAQNYNVTLPQQCNPNTGGTEIITFPSTPPNANGDATLTIDYRGDLDLATEKLTFFDESGNILGQTVSTTQCTGINTFTAVLPMATIINWASDGQIVFTAVADASVNNNLTACIGLSSFCVTASLDYPVSTAPNDLGVLSLDSPTSFFCSGNFDLYVTVVNYGTNAVNNHQVNWVWNGAAQTPVNITTTLDTINGAGSSSLQVLLGNKLVTGTNTLVVWTSLPNGVPDTINSNDTLSATIAPSVQAPSALSASNVTPTSADFSWVGGLGGQFELEYGQFGFSLGTGVNVLTTNNPYSVTSLIQNTQYEFYVRSICGPGDTSSWAGPYFFKTPCVPSVTAFPYFANFDGATTDWIVGGTNTTWALGTPANTIINSPASAPNSWVTNLTGQYNNSENGWVEGPCIAFDTLIAPEVSVDIWYNAEFSWDGMQLQYSLDAGATWIKVSSYGDPNSINWYTDNTVNGLVTAINDGDGWSGRNSSSNGSGGWITAKADLSSISGSPSVKFRFVFGADGSVQDEGVAFDNFSIVETALPNNIKLVDISSPNSGCGLSATEIVNIEYANIGLNTILTGTTLNFDYYLNGVATNETFVLTADLLPGDTLPYTFTTPADLSTPGTYAFGVVASYANDQNPLDDSLGYSIVSIPVISSFPYYQDFESGNGGWTAGGANSTWALGTPAGAVINSASSGSNAWVTNLTGNYNNSEQSYVLGPCFDFTNLVLPVIKLDANWNSENSWDGMKVEASTDAGVTWIQIGSFGDPFNWYNDNTVNGLAFTGIQDGWTGNAGTGSNGWLTAKNDLSSFAGNSGVLMRVVFGSDASVNGYDGTAFDNFHILESPNNDIAVDSLIGLQSGCGYTDSTIIRMRVTNLGIVPQTNVPVYYTVNGVASPVENIPTTINPGSTLIYQFTNAADLSVPQIYTVIGHSALSIDEDTTNDNSPTKFFQSLFTPKVLSVTDGETCESGPVTLSMTSNGDTDRWFTSPFGGTAVGTGSSFTIPNVTKDTTLYVQTVMNVTGCNSATAQGRIAVHAEHSTTPIINYTTAVAGNLIIQFTTSLSANVDSIRWDFGDGTTSTIANTLHLFPSSKSYLVTLTAYAGSCIADTTKGIFVPVGGINDDPLANLTVFPNPSNGAFRISVDGIQGEVLLEIVSITGNVVYTENVQALNGKLIHNIYLDNVSSGTYILKLQNDQTIINGRLLID